MKTKGCRVLSIILAAAVLAAMTEYPYSEKKNDMTELRAGYDLNLVAYSSLSDENSNQNLSKAVTGLVNATRLTVRTGLDNYSKKVKERQALAEEARKAEEAKKASEEIKEETIAEEPPAKEEKPQVKEEKPQVSEAPVAQKKTDVLTDSLNGPFDGFATEMLRQINEYRAANGVRDLKLSSICVEAANVRVQEQVSAFSHTRPNGTRFLTVYDDLGYKGVFDIKGENLQKHSDASYDIDTASLVTEAIENFKLSESHNALMLSDSYEYVGFAVYFPGNDIIFIAQEFGD